jgi:class 3 adenylate cyclase/predicted ATPase
VDIAAWLRELGLERYEPVFRDNEIDWEILPELTDGDLEKLGLPLGPRKKLLKAIAGLSGKPTAISTEVAPGPRPVAPEAERRQLTVLFCDLVGSTELSARLDPEDMSAVIRAYQNAVAGEITRFEGHVAKFMGDGVLAYFGYPKAHEDAAERAVRAGLALVGAVGRQVTPTGAPLAARIGIATGLVVVGELIGEGAAQEEAVVGETPNLAARLQADASPGSVVISQGTRRLVGGLFELDDLGHQRVKGFTEPLSAWRVLGEGTEEGRFEALRGAGLTSLIGREHELGLLLDRWQLARAGEGQVVQLFGEPGIGKSRILQSLRETLANERHVRLRYYCSPYHSNSAYYPFIVQLGRAAGFERDDSTSEKLEKLEQLLAGASDLNEVMPVVAALLSIPTSERYPPTSLSPQRQKARIFETFLQQLEGLATQDPVLVVLEDMHWIDPTSLELFDQLVDRVERLRVLLVASCRPDMPPRWMGYPHVSTLTLTRLGRAQAAAIVDAMTGGRGLPGHVLDHILGRTDGVPLFVEELTKVVLESGLLQLEENRYALCGPVPPLAIPATLQDSLMARLDRLAPVKEVAQIGAVIGREFAHELVEAVSTLPEAELGAAMDQLVEAELIFRRGTSPRITYSFKHALVQDAAYDSLLRGRRQILHAQIGEALETRFPETTHAQPELVAHHFTQAGLVDKALEHWKKAGQLAMARSATAEAIAHLNSGLKILLSLPESKQRDRQELGIQLAMGSAMVAARGFAAPKTGEAYERAREICERLGDIRELFPVLYGLCLFHLYAADLTSARAASDRLLELAGASDDRGLFFFAHRAAGVSLYPAGDLLAAREHLERALALYDPTEHSAPAFVYAFQPRVVCLDYLARTLFPLGLVDQSLDHNGEALAEARRTGHRNSLALPLFFGATLRQLLGDCDAVRAMADELGALATEEGFRFWFAGATILRGWVAAENGDVQGGMRTIQSGIAEWQATGAEYMLPYFSVLLAQAQIRAGQADAAALLLHAAVQRIERSRERWFECEVYRTAGLVNLQLDPDDSSGAERCFQRALEVAREQSARLWELRAAMDLASLWLERGRQAEARDLLTPIYAAFDEGSDAPDLLRAAGLLRNVQAAS